MQRSPLARPSRPSRPRAAAARPLLYVVGAAAMAAGAIRPAEAGAQQSGAGTGVGVPAPRELPSITTSAHGEAHLAPDRATIILGVQTRATTAAAASSDNARKTRAVLEAIIALGIAREQLSTLGYTAYPQTRYDQPSGATHVVGYMVTNSVRVDVKRIDQVGPVIDAGTGAGANVVTSLSFYSSAAEEAHRTALASAVVAARADAEAMARAAGGGLGPLLDLSTQEGFPPRPMGYAPAMLAAARSEAAPTPIEPGEQTITATVTARWQFLPR